MNISFSFWGGFIRRCGLPGSSGNSVSLFETPPTFRGDRAISQPSSRVPGAQRLHILSNACAHVFPITAIRGARRGTWLLVLPFHSPPPLSHLACGAGPASFLVPLGAGEEPSQVGANAPFPGALTITMVTWLFSASPRRNPSPGQVAEGSLCPTCEAVSPGPFTIKHAR